MSLVSSNPGQLDGSSVCLRLLWSWHCWRTMVSSFISGPQFDCLTFSHEETEVIEFWQEGRRSDVCHSYCITSEGTWCPHITTLNFLHKEVVLMMMARLSPDLTCPVPSPCSTPRSNPADSHFWLWSFSLSLMSFGHLDPKSSEHPPLTALVPLCFSGLVSTSPPFQECLRGVTVLCLVGAVCHTQHCKPSALGRGQCSMKEPRTSKGHARNCNNISWLNL